MQDKNLTNDKDQVQNQNPETTSTDGTTAEDGVVYVMNDDGTAFDSSDRTYVAVEGLEGELGSDNNTDKAEKNNEGAA